MRSLLLLLMSWLNIDKLLSVLLFVIIK